MFEQMLKDYIIKLIRQDPDVILAIIASSREAFDTSVQHAVKHVIETDESVQDVIRKQATTDIWEAIEDDVDTAIVSAIDELVVVRR